MNELVRKAQKMQKMTKLVLAPTTPPWIFILVGFNSKKKQENKGAQIELWIIMPFTFKRAIKCDCCCFESEIGAIWLKQIGLGWFPTGPIWT